MSAATLQIRLDSSLKREADTFFSDAGLDLSSAVRLFLRQTVLRQAMPFEIVSSRTRVPNALTRKTIEDSEKGVGLTEYDNAADFYAKMGI